MKSEYPIQAARYRLALASAIALALSSPLYATSHMPGMDAADTERSTSAADRGAGKQAKPADNSVHNAGDSAHDKLTPFDQSEAKADVDMTRAIRKTLVDDDSLGTNAKNIKVITVDGMVTLRGAVASADEKARIVVIANQAAGAERVQDELEIIKR